MQRSAEVNLMRFLMQHVNAVTGQWKLAKVVTLKETTTEANTNDVLEFL